MPQLHKLTKEQKVLLSGKDYNPKDYLLLRNLPNTLIVVNKTTKEHLVVEKKDKGDMTHEHNPRT